MRVRYCFAFLYLTALSGCAAQGPVVQGDSLCRIDKPLGWSKNDTNETITGIRKHNARHRRVCG